MATKLLTNTEVKNARSSSENLLADGDGLYLRVRPTGKDWLLIYSYDGKRRKQGLGSYPLITLEMARSKAQESKRQLSEGIEPKAARQRALEAKRAAAAADAARLTVQGLFEEWSRRELRSRKDSGAEIRRAFEKDVLPSLGARYADEIRRRDVVGVLDAVKERGVTRYANLLLQHLRQMFRFAAVREIVTGDPTFGLTKRDVGGQEVERDRHLSEKEISLLAAQLPLANLGIGAEVSLWIMLSTLCRVGEISRARIEDIDLDEMTWTIPAEHSKNGEAHLIHLSSFAMAQFKRLLQPTSATAWVLPSRDGDSHLGTKFFRSSTGIVNVPNSSRDAVVA